MPFYPRVRFARLETPRLILRAFEERDVAPFTAYRSDPEVARFQGWQAPFPPDEAARFVTEMIQARPGIPGVWYQVAIELRSSGENNRRLRLLRIRRRAPGGDRLHPGARPPKAGLCRRGIGPAAGLPVLRSQPAPGARQYRSTEHPLGAPAETAGFSGRRALCGKPVV